MKPTSWHPAFDITTVPDDILLAEAARRNARRRHTYTGGQIWAKHNPNTLRCRCARCTEQRQQKTH